MECCLETSNIYTIKNWTALRFFIWNLDNTTTSSRSKCELVIWMFYRYCVMNVYKYMNFVYSICETYVFNLLYCTCMIWFMSKKKKEKEKKKEKKKKRFFLNQVYFAFISPRVTLVYMRAGRRRKGRRLTSSDLIHKSQNAHVPYPIMLYSEQKCTHFCSTWSILWYGTGAIRDCEIGLLTMSETGGKQ